MRLNNEQLMKELNSIANRMNLGYYFLLSKPSCCGYNNIDKLDINLDYFMNNQSILIRNQKLTNKTDTKNYKFIKLFIMNNGKFVIAYNNEQYLMNILKRIYIYGLPFIPLLVNTPKTNVRNHVYKYEIHIELKDLIKSLGLEINVDSLEQKLRDYKGVIENYNNIMRRRNIINEDSKELIHEIEYNNDSDKIKLDLKMFLFHEGVSIHTDDWNNIPDDDFKTVDILVDSNGDIEICEYNIEYYNDVMSKLYFEDIPMLTLVEKCGKELNLKELVKKCLEERQGKEH